MNVHANGCQRCHCGKASVLATPLLLVLLLLGSADGSVTFRRNSGPRYVPLDISQTVHDTSVNAESIEEAIEQLKDGQSFVFDTYIFQLTRTVYINATGVTIRGAAYGTTVLCPEGSGAMIISAAGVVVEGLIIKDCRSPNGALQIIEGYTGYQLPAENPVEGAKMAVIVRKCQFTGCQSVLCDEKCAAAMRVGHRSAVHVESCTFSRNFERAVYVHDGAYIRINDSIFTANSAKGAGGAMLIDGESTSTTDPAILSNAILDRADSPFYQGAGEKAVTGPQTSVKVIIDNCRFEQSKAQDSGAILATAANISIRHSHFTNNKANRFIGAISVQQSEVIMETSLFKGNNAIRRAVMHMNLSSVKVIDCAFKQNTADQHIGVFLASHTKLDLLNTTFFDNRANIHHGVFYLDNSAFDITACTFEKNKAPRGYQGVGTVASGSRIMIRRSVFENNLATGSGGCLVIRSSNLSVSSSTFKGNKARKGGVFACISATVEINNSRFIDNVADSIYHEVTQARTTNALYARSSRFPGDPDYSQTKAETEHQSQWSRSDTPFASNYIESEVAAIWLTACETRISNCEFIGNIAYGDSGAIKVVKKSAVISDTVFRRNSARRDTGAILMKNATVKLTNCTFEGNRADRDKGALQMNNATVFLERSSFRANHGGNSEGVFWMELTLMNISSCTFADNTVLSNNSIGAVYDSNLMIEKSLFQNNTASISAAGLRLRDSELVIEKSTFKQYGTQQTAIILAENTSILLRDSDFKDMVDNSCKVLMLAYHSAVTIGNCRFVQNRVTGSAGIIGVSSSSLTITKSLFEDNEAVRGSAGALWLMNSTVHINNCIFSKNQAFHDGGAIWTKFSTVTINGSNFTENRADRNGGGMNILGGTVQICSSCFSSNSAGRNGGAIRGEGSTVLTLRSTNFKLNHASLNGGALTLSESTLRLPKAIDSKVSYRPSLGNTRLNTNLLLFANNTAKTGGAMYLSLILLKDQRCLSMTAASDMTKILRPKLPANTHGGLVDEIWSRFLGNTAKEIGGAMFISDAVSKSTLCKAEFRENFAEKGGAVALVNTKDYHLRDSIDVTSVKFIANGAMNGGALYIQCHDAKMESYKIARTLFRDNWVLISLGSTTMARGPVPEKWLKEASRAIEEKRLLKEQGKCKDCIFGGGGAVFISLSSIKERRVISISFKNVAITDNVAETGGGVYLESRGVGWSFDNSTSVCTNASSLSEDSCLFLDFQNVTVTGNEAINAGGGVYIVSLKNTTNKGGISFFSEGDNIWICFNLSSDTLGSTVHSRSKTTHCMLVKGNNITSEAGYGPDVATDAHELKALNVKGRITGLPSSEFITVCDDGGIDCPVYSKEPIKIAVRDMIGQTISGYNKDANLLVVVIGTGLSGPSTYTAIDGVISIDHTSVRRAGFSGSIKVVASDRRRELTAIIKFETRICAKGVPYDHESEVCFPCLKGQYILKPYGKCVNCSSNAICPGSSVNIPKEGFWHSTPFSPSFRRCLVKESCSRKSREADLEKFYDVYPLIRKVLEKLEANKTLNADEVEDELPHYEQCADCYEGILCGSCSESCGRSSDGLCMPCTANKTGSIIRTILMACLLIGSLGLKLFLTIDASWTNTATELAAKRIILETAAQSEEGQGSMTMDEGPSEGYSASRRDGDTRELARSVAVSDIDTAKSSLSQRARTLNQESMDAARMLTDTFNILYNYLQLNSVALSLKTNWGFGLNFILKIQASIGRLTNVIQVVPFGCLMNRNSQKTMSTSMQGVWYRSLFPLAAMALFTLATHIWNVFASWSSKKDTRTDLESAALMQSTVHETKGNDDGDQDGDLSTEEPRRHNNADRMIPKRLVLLVVFTATVIDIVSEFLRVINCAYIPGTDPSHEYAQYDNATQIHVWVEDTSIICYKGEHLTAVIFAGVGLSLCFSALVFIVYVLHFGKRHLRLGTREYLLQYSFLYSAYRKDGIALYWEAVITVRRILMAVFSVYTQYGSTSNVQLGFLSAIVFGALIAHSIVYPFDHTDSQTTFPKYAGSTLRRLRLRNLSRRWVAYNRNMSFNELENTALQLSLLVFMTAMAVNGGNSSSSASIFLNLGCFVMNAVFVFFLIYRLWYAAHNHLDVKIRCGEISPGGCSLNEVNLETTLLAKKLFWACTGLVSNTVLSKGIGSANPFPSIQKFLHLCPRHPPETSQISRDTSINEGFRAGSADESDVDP